MIRRWLGTDYADQRRRMVEQQIAGRGLTDPRLLNAFRAVPRELFVPHEQQRRSYDDCALPIEAGQTISQPYIVAVTIAAAQIQAEDRVLEIGAGSGYAAAVVARMARQVIAIERVGELAQLASERVRRLGYDNVRILEGDGSLGFAKGAPFDAILCAAAGPRVPEAWLDQLAPGGRVIMPVGPQHSVQQLMRVSVAADGCRQVEALEPVRFVPLIGAAGYSER